METPNERELQKIAYNRLSDVDFRYFMNFYKKMYCKTIFFFSYLLYSCIRQPFTLKIESFRNNIKTNHDK